MLAEPDIQCANHQERRAQGRSASRIGENDQANPGVRAEERNHLEARPCLRME